MNPAALFDLGNTLAAYYRTDEFGPILERAIADVHRDLTAREMTHVNLGAAQRAALEENREAPDHRFTPLSERLERIFDIAVERDSAAALCRRFLRPIFAVGRLYDDALPALERLREADVPIGIVSNAPWGSPPDLWREELERLGLLHQADAIVLCGDAGWRKPAAEIFRQAAASVGREAGDCIFVGDDPVWDIAGSRAVGMRAILIDRGRRYPDYDGDRAIDLNGVLEIIGLE